MEIDAYEPGIPSWVDVSTPDLDGAKAFYSALFGWEIAEAPPEAGGYSIAYLAERRVAGVGPQMNPQAPPAWMQYVNVTDADAAAAKVTAAGGQVFVPPMDVLDAGRMAVFADPAGAVFGIWEPKEHKGAGLVNEPGTFSWSELITTDIEGAKAFYGAVFGWESVTHGEGPGAYTEWQVAGRSMAGMMAKPAEMPAAVPPFWGVYFAVADADAALAKANELGGSTMMGPMDIEPGRFAVLVDPAGALFNVIALSAPPAG